MAGFTYPFVSTQTMMTDPDFLKQVLEINADQRSLLDLMEVLPNSKVVTKNPKFRAKFAKSVLKKGIVDGAPTYTAAAGNSATITLTRAIDLPRVGDLATWGAPAGGLDNIGKVVSINATAKTFVCEPLEATKTLGAPATTDEVIYPGSAHEEGSDAPDGSQAEWYDTENCIQIFKDADEITDLADALALKVEHNGSDKLLYKMETDLYLKHRLKVSAGMITGVQSEKIVGDKATYTTQGLVNYVKGGDGKVLTVGGQAVDVSGGVGLDKFQTSVRLLRKTNAPKHYLLVSGGGFKLKAEASLRALEGVKNGIDYSKWGTGDSKQRSIDLGIDSFRYGGYQLDIKDFDMFDDPQLFGSKGYTDLSESAIWVPQSQVKVNHGEGSVNRMRIRYKRSSDGKDWMHSVNESGRLAGLGTKSILKVDYETIAGLECLGVEQFLIMNG